MHQEMCLHDYSRYLTHISARHDRTMHVEWAPHCSGSQRKLVSKDDSDSIFPSFDKEIDAASHRCIRKCVCMIIPDTLRIFRPDMTAQCM